MIGNAIALLIFIPFILGFMTYGIRRLITPSPETHNPVSIKISTATLKQLKEHGYLDPNTGKLKDAAIGSIHLEEAKS